MSDLEYYNYEEDWKKRFEVTIPILLLVLVLLVLAWKLGWLCGIPVVGAKLCGGEVINVLIIGNDPDVAQMLDQMKVEEPISYEIFTLEDMKNLRDPSYLDKYDLFILTEKVYEDHPSYLPSLFRNYLAQRLSNNGKLIVIGIAGSRDPEEPASNGWKAGLDKFIPVTCTTGLCDESNSKDVHATSIVDLKINDINHPMLKEFGMTASISEGASIQYSLVNVDNEGKVLVTLEVQAGAETLAYPAIVEGTHGLTGKTIYFAYHPARTPRIFKNAVDYLMGRLNG